MKPIADEAVLAEVVSYSAHFSSRGEAHQKKPTGLKVMFSMLCQPDGCPMFLTIIAIYGIYSGFELAVAWQSALAGNNFGT